MKVQVWNLIIYPLLGGPTQRQDVQGAAAAYRRGPQHVSGSTGACRGPAPQKFPEEDPARGPAKTF